MAARRSTASKPAPARPGGSTRDPLERAVATERALREIAFELANLRDPELVVQRVVRAAGRLVAADGAILSRYDPEDGLLHWGVDDGVRDAFDEAYVRSLTLEIGMGLTGRAVAERRVLRADEGLIDEFPRSPESDHFFEVTGFRAMIAAPIVSGETLFGALEVYSAREGTFDQRDEEILEAFAAQAAAALANARLIEDLDRSRQAIRQRAERERALREMGARLTAVEDVDTVLRRIVAEAHRLLSADGARIDLLDETTLHLRWMYAAGETAEADARLLREEGLPLGRGVAGKAAAEGRAVLTGDVGSDPDIDRPPASVQFIAETGVRSVLSAPLPGGERPLGTLTVLSRQVDAFGPEDVDLLVTFALQAAIAIANTRRMEALRRATDENARRADRERTLREIAGRLGRLRDAAGIVQLAVDAAARLLDADGARIDAVGEAGRSLRRRLGEVVSDERFRLGARPEVEEQSGVSGEAMRRGRAYWTDDYVADRSFARTPQQDDDVMRLGVRSVIAAPIQGDEGALGALTALSHRPAAFGPDDAVTLEALAGLAGAALHTAELLQRVRDSEARYRFRLGASPDMAWEADADGITRFVSAASRTIFGREPQEMVGRHFGEFITPATADAAVAGWATLVADPGVVHSSQFSVRHADGSEVPLENFAVGLVDAAGRFVGAHGSVRDLRERLRLERELTESQLRYRMLVEHSPDVVWQTDPDGAFVYLSESIERQLGWRPDELVGRPFTEIVDEADLPLALARVAAISADPSRSDEVTLRLIHRDGRRIPFDIRGTGLVRDGRIVGIHGASRDVSERVRLEQEVRDSEARFRELVQTSPDGVWQTDAQGTLVFWSDAAVALLGWEPSELRGRHWTAVVEPEARDAVRANLKPLEDAAGGTVARVRAMVVRRDGSAIPAEISGVPLIRDGRFVGIQGTVRDLRAQVRLERELRDQAGALASAEERAHLARELHDSVTQALFSMGLLMRSTEVLIDRDPPAAKARLDDLRSLQREALAEMRSLVFELRPGSLQQEGLGPALRTHIGAVEARLGLPVALDIDDIGRLPLGAEDALYRIAQEALHNVLKHAAAQDVRIELRRETDEVVLRVRDDGIGFDESAVPVGHLGLAGMRSRAARAGGTIVVSSSPGAGTLVEVRLPVDERPMATTPVIAPDLGGAGPSGAPAGDAGPGSRSS